MQGLIRPLVDSLHVASDMVPLFIHREELEPRYLSRVLTSHHSPNNKFVKNPIDWAINEPNILKSL